MENRIRSGYAGVLCFFALAASAFGQATLTFAPPAVAKPPNVVVQPGNTTVIPDTFRLVGSGNYTTLLNDIANVQGFTNEYGWFFNSQTLGNTANFNVTTYGPITVTPFATGGQIAEPTQFTFAPGNTVIPNGATFHWLQILNEDQQYGTTEGGGSPFGYTLSGLPGYWEFDNGDIQNNGTGVGPFYDSNGGPAPNLNFSDNPTVGHAIPGTYLHFITIPTWEVGNQNGGTVYYGAQAATWGYVVVPEPGSLSILVITIGTLATRRTRRTP